jgi:hypothetical protein
MTTTVRCSFCGAHYDMKDIKIIARHADATVFRTPCCDHEADDRTWKGHNDYEVIEADGTPIKNTAGEVIGRWHNGIKFFWAR